jgi:hypothetical protein
VAIAAHQLAIFAPQLDKLFDDFIFARLLSAQRGREAVSLRVFAEKLEAGVSIARRRAACGSALSR